MARMSNNDVRNMYYNAKAEIHADWQQLSTDQHGRPLSAMEILDKMRNRTKAEWDAHEHAINRREFAGRVAEEREI